MEKTREVVFAAWLRTSPESPVEPWAAGRTAGKMWILFLHQKGGWNMLKPYK